MGEPEGRSYPKYQGMRKLGDRALSAGEYEKAIEYYEQALHFFNIPNHPKYLAVLDGIQKAKTELLAKAGASQPKGVVQDGIINSRIIHIRLYSNRQLPSAEWEKVVLSVLASTFDNHPQLKETVALAGKNCQVKTSWEYVPYYDAAFRNVATDRGRTFLESLLASQNPRLCRSFSFEVSYPVYEEQAQGMILAVVFGDEMG